jgi:hypothetical protein
MDIVQMIKDAIHVHALNNALVDVYYGHDGEISVYVADETFTNLDEYPNEKLWNALESSLPVEIFVKIGSLFIETFDERSKRRNNYIEELFLISKVWVHILPTGGRFWLFIDVKSDTNGYESVYYMVEICKDRLEYKDAMRYIYNNEVVNFMKLSGTKEDFAVYLLRDVFRIGQNIIQSKLMEKYESFKNNEKLYGNDNPYRYAFSQLNLTPVERLEMILTVEESKLISQYVVPQLTDFDVHNTLAQGVKYIERLDSIKQSLKID